MNSKPTINVPPELLSIMVTDVLDILPNIDNVRITWLTDGKEVDIKKLDDRWLPDIGAFTATLGFYTAFDIIAAEVYRRVNGKYPNDFKQIIKEYIRNPETWKLKIHY